MTRSHRVTEACFFFNIFGTIRTQQTGSLLLPVFLYRYVTIFRVQEVIWLCIPVAYPQLISFTFTVHGHHGYSAEGLFSCEEPEDRLSLVLAQWLG